MARKRKEIKNEAVVKDPDSQASDLKDRYTAKPSNARTVSSQETGQEDVVTSISIQEKVALLAYGYWEERGKQGGSPEEDWYRAEKEILTQMSHRVS